MNVQEKLDKATAEINEQAGVYNKLVEQRKLFDRKISESLDILKSLQGEIKAYKSLIESEDKPVKQAKK